MTIQNLPLVRSMLGHSSSSDAIRCTSPVMTGSSLAVGSRIWIPCEEQVWRAGVVVDCKDELVNDCMKHSAVVEVEGDRETQQLVIDLSSTSKGGPGYMPRSEELLTKQNAQAVEDLSLLPLLAEPEVLHALNMRYTGQSIYTFAGPMLLAVNPYQEIPGLYDNDQLEIFANVPNGCPSPIPHIFGIARDAFLGIQHSKMAQTVLVSGESGAGKTESAKFVIRFLALAGGRHPDRSEVTMEHRVLESVPLLEALGNARTLKNDNSSRFGKFIELQFKHMVGVFGPCIVDAETHTYLLETVRVTELNEGERCFHIFYQILAAAARARQQSSLNGSSEAPPLQLSPLVPGLTFSDISQWTRQKFAFLAQSSCAELSGVDDEALQFDRTLKAMKAFDITDDEISEVVGAIVAVLHLGNIRFKDVEGNAEAAEIADAEDVKGSLRRASDLLGVKTEELATALCTRALQVHEKSTKQVIRTCRTASQAATCRDALARHLYGMLFKYVVSRINKVLSGRGSPGSLPVKSSSLPSIGVLDIFGFEVFERNCFEQLCINFANEVLQQHFNMVVFEHELALYESEGIPCDVQEAHAAVPQQHLRDSVVRSGLFPMLDEECSLAGGTSETWLNKVVMRYGNSSVFQLNQRKKGHFIVHHFAGPVEYCADAFLAKNKDHFSIEGMECMQGSTKKVLQQQFANHGRKFGTSFSPTKAGRVLRAKVHTVSSDFRDQLDNLMRTIQATRTHFVRCLRPNQIAAPGSFDFHSVLQQLRYQGVLEAIRVARFGYAFRLSHQQAVRTYRTLAPSWLSRQLQEFMGSEMYQQAAQALFTHLKESLPGLKANGVQVGKSLTFFRTEAMEVLGMHVRAYRIAAAIQVQSVWRAIRSSRHFKAVCKAVLEFQRAGRGYLARRTFRKCRRGVLCLQAWRRGSQQRHYFQMTVKIIVRLQRWIRKSLAARKRRLNLMVECPPKNHQSQIEGVGTPKSAKRVASAECIGPGATTQAKQKPSGRTVSKQRPAIETAALRHYMQSGGSMQVGQNQAVNKSSEAVASPRTSVASPRTPVASPRSRSELKTLQDELVSEILGLHDAVRVLQNMIKASEGQQDAASSASQEQQQAHQALQADMHQNFTAMREEVSMLGSNISAIQGKVQQLSALERMMADVHGEVQQVQADSAAKSFLLSNLSQEQQRAKQQIQAMDGAVRAVQASANQAFWEEQHRSLHSNLQSQLTEMREEAKEEVTKLNAKFMALLEKYQLQAPIKDKLEQLWDVERSINELRGDLRQVQTQSAEKEPLLDKLERGMPALEQSVDELRGAVRQVQAHSVQQAPLVEKFEQISALERSMMELRGEVQQAQALSADKAPMLSQILEQVEALESSMNEMRVDMRQVQAYAVVKTPKIDRKMEEITSLQMSINEIRGDVRLIHEHAVEKAKLLDKSEQLKALERSITELRGEVQQFQTDSVQKTPLLSKLERVPSLERSINELRRDVQQVQASSLEIQKASLSDRLEQVPALERLINQMRGDMQQVQARSVEKQELEDIKSRWSTMSQEQDKTVEKLRSIDAAVSAAKEQTEAQQASMREEHNALQLSLQMRLTEMKKETTELSSSLLAFSENQQHHAPIIEKLEKISALENSILELRSDVQQVRADAAEKHAFLSGLCQERERSAPETRSIEATVSAVKEQTEMHQARLNEEHHALQANLQMQLSAMRQEVASLVRDFEADRTQASNQEFEEFVKTKFSVLEESMQKAKSDVVQTQQQHLQEALYMQQQRQTETLAALRAEMAGSWDETLVTLQQYMNTAHGITRDLDTRYEGLRADIANQQESVDRLCTDLQPKIHTMASKNELADLQQHVRDLLDKHKTMRDQHQNMSVACDDLKVQLSNVLEAQQQHHTSALNTLRAEMAGSLEEALTTLRQYLDTAHSLTRSLDTHHEAQQEQAADLAALRDEVAGSIESALSSLHKDLDATQIMASQASQSQQQGYQTPQRLPLRQLPMPSMSVRTRASPATPITREVTAPGSPEVVRDMGSPCLSSPGHPVQGSPCLSSPPHSLTTPVRPGRSPVSVTRTARELGSALRAQGRLLSPQTVTRAKVIAPPSLVSTGTWTSGAATRTETPPIASFGPVSTTPKVVRRSAVSREPAGRQSSAGPPPGAKISGSILGSRRAVVKTDTRPRTFLSRTSTSPNGPKVPSKPFDPAQGLPFLSLPSPPTSAHPLSATWSSTMTAAPQSMRTTNASPSSTPRLPQSATSARILSPVSTHAGEARSAGVPSSLGAKPEDATTRRSLSPNGTVVHLTAAGATLVNRQHSVPAVITSDARTRSPPLLEATDASTTRIPSMQHMPVTRLASQPLTTTIMRQRSSSPQGPPGVVYADSPSRKRSIQSLTVADPNAQVEIRRSSTATTF